VPSTKPWKKAAASFGRRFNNPKNASAPGNLTSVLYAVNTRRGYHRPQRRTKRIRLQAKKKRIARFDSRQYSTDNAARPPWSLEGALVPAQNYLYLKLFAYL